MGDVFGENKPGRVYGSDEHPLHEACVADYLIGTHEVTQGVWWKIMGTRPPVKNYCEDCPVVYVSWDDVQGFIRRLRSETGRQYRLPTEAEWEYACRSGGKREGYCGGGNEDAVAWHAGNSDRRVHGAGQKRSNGLGVYDMSGNVAEWCQDWYGDYPDGSVSDYAGPVTGTRRVFRGGSWCFDATYARASARASLSPDQRAYFLGFRLAVSVPGGAQTRNGEIVGGVKKQK
jgi:formylglycine-generating enzyme required for sulfatase activity